MATQQQRSDETRLKLLQAFRSAFLERGYAQTTVQQILDQTGLSKGALYHHFRSKEEIIEALFEHESRSTIERVMAGLDPSAPPLDRLRAACLEWTKQVRAPDISRIIFEIGPTALGNQKAKQIEDRFALGHIESLLAAAVRSGEIQTTNLTLVAAFLNAMVAEAALHFVRTGSDTTTTLASSIDALFDGMRR